MPDNWYPCPNCSVENRLDALFCRGCGGPLPAAFLEHPASAGQFDDVAPPAGAPGTSSAGPAAAPAGPDASIAGEELELEANPRLALPDPPLDWVEPANPSEGEPLDPGELRGRDTVPLVPPEILPLYTLLQGRYRIEGVVEGDLCCVTYLAFDVEVCRHCGEWVGDADADGYCAACGEPLAPYRAYHLRSMDAPSPDDTLIDPKTPYFIEGGKLYLMVPAPGQEAPEPNKEFSGVYLQVGFQSDRGQLRELDEDSILVTVVCGMYEGVCRQTLGFFAVADGIGGHKGGEIASREAVQALGREVIVRVFSQALGTERPFTTERLSRILEESVGKVNRHLLALRQERSNDMGTTLTAALLLDDLAVVANVGDSRTYLWREDKLVQITQDHSLIANLIATGMERPEAIYTHEQRNLIFRSLGDKLEVKVDTFPLQLFPGDQLILCCDGVWEMIRDEGVEEVMAAGLDPQATCDLMVERSNAAGGEDNISVVVVAVGTTPASREQGWDGLRR